MTLRKQAARVSLHRRLHSLQSLLRGAPQQFSGGGRMHMQSDADGASAQIRVFALAGRWFESDGSGSGLITVAADIPVGQWSQLAFTRSASGSVQLYLNGTALGDPQLSAVAPASNGAAFTLGY